MLKRLVIPMVGCIIGSVVGNKFGEYLGNKYKKVSINNQYYTDRFEIFPSYDKTKELTEDERMEIVIWELQHM